MEKGNLPQAYTNLGFDDDPVAGPSAPRSDVEDVIVGAVGGAQPIPGPSTPPPKYEEAGPSGFSPFYQKAPTAPPSNDLMICQPGTLQCTPPSLVFEEIYEACILYVKRNCCYSSRFARQMKLTSIGNQCAFHYTLESFGEKRESAWRYTPYKGGEIDGPENGPPPHPWDMSVSTPTMFQDSTTQKLIPHTESVETCSRCDGSGEVRCSSCSGSGTRSCWKCSGSGRDNDETCSSCSGSGTERCSSCSGSGRVTCSKCDGYGKIKNYKVLYVTWKNHKTHWVSNIHKVPAKKFQQVAGDTLFTDTKEKVLPIVNAPDSTVNAASARLLEAHRNSFTSELIIKQRHSLRSIPFTVAKYTWKDTEGEFYIFGKEREVYFDDYPTDCCCICC